MGTRAVANVRESCEAALLHTAGVCAGLPRNGGCAWHVPTSERGTHRDVAIMLRRSSHTSGPWQRDLRERLHIKLGVDEGGAKPSMAEQVCNFLERSSMVHHVRGNGM